jgi:hypothetical protein
MMLLVSLTAVVCSLSIDSATVALDQAEMAFVAARDAFVVPHWMVARAENGLVEQDTPPMIDLPDLLGPVALDRAEARPAEDPDPAEVADRAPAEPQPGPAEVDVGPPEPAPAEEAAEARPAPDTALLQKEVERIWGQTEDLLQHISSNLSRLVQIRFLTGPGQAQKAP